MRIVISVALAMLVFQTSRAATVTFNGGVEYQAIDGFGVNANHRSWNNDELKPVLDALIDQAGMTLFRVVYDDTNWEANNDNSDPNVMNWSYYAPLYSNAAFTKLWNLIAYLNSKGITTNGVIFNFMGPGPSWMGGGTLTTGKEAEWAEMITSLLVWACYTNGLQFNLVAPDNEPDISNEGITITSANQYMTALRALAQKLDANGLSDLRLVGPRQHDLAVKLQRDVGYAAKWVAAEGDGDGSTDAKAGMREPLGLYREARSLKHFLRQQILPSG